MKKDTVRLNFEFPRKEYPYLKMICAKKGLTLRDFATALIIKEIEEYEDKWFVEEAQKRLEETDDSGNIPFDEACKLAGWESD